MANNYVMPFVDDSPTILNLIVNHARAKVDFDGDFSEFLQKYGMEKLPTDKAAVSIAVWASLGGYIGLEHPYLIEDWIHWMYDEPEDLLTACMFVVRREKAVTFQLCESNSPRPHWSLQDR